MVAHALLAPPDCRTILLIVREKVLYRCHAGAILFRESDPADATYYIESGRVKLTRVSENGREAIVALLGPGDFVGEGCLLGQPDRLASAECISDCRLWRLESDYLIGLFRRDSDFAGMFLAYLLSRNDRYQDDLADQLFNSTDKRLARALLLLAHFGGNGEPLRSVPALSHESLAELVGTTRARVTLLMNRFRRMGFVDYNRNSINVRGTLLKVLLRD